MISCLFYWLIMYYSCLMSVVGSKAGIEAAWMSCQSKRRPFPELRCEMRGKKSTEEKVGGCQDGGRCCHEKTNMWVNPNNLSHTHTHTNRCSLRHSAGIFVAAFHTHTNTLTSYFQRACALINEQQINSQHNRLLKLSWRVTTQDLQLNVIIMPEKLLNNLHFWLTCWLWRNYRNSLGFFGVNQNVTFSVDLLTS